jgi:hypothetical protein
VPPQPSAVPQGLSPQLGVQQVPWWQVWPLGHPPQSTPWPQLSVTVPHLPAQVVATGCGVQQPPPEQTSPACRQHVPPQATPPPAQHVPTPLAMETQLVPAQQSVASSQRPPAPPQPPWQVPATQTPEQQAASVPQLDPAACKQAPPQQPCPVPQAETQAWDGPQTRH